jgi:DNA-binding IclR family transcriptional regulator
MHKASARFLLPSDGTAHVGGEMAGNTATPGRTVTSRVLAILGAFDSRHRNLSLGDLARRADLALTTAHRLTGELAEWGALTRVPGGYAIGSKLWELGLLAPAESDLRQIAAPFINDIHAATRATVQLGVRDGGEVLYLARSAGHGDVAIRNGIGSRLPLHATGVGKVLLAHAPADVAGDVLHRLERITPYTVTQPGRLARQLQQVRTDGYATTAEEMSLGACSVAVPVVDAEHRVRAALGVVVPELGRDVGRYVSVLSIAANGIARQLN